MKLDPALSLAEVVGTHPLSARVFLRHGIDFCCRGAWTLETLCLKRGLQSGELINEIRDEEERFLAQDGVQSLGPAELVAYIVERHHRPLDAELPRIEALARLVRRSHADKEPERLEAVLQEFLALKRELQPHMTNEEKVLFPALARGEGAQMVAAVRLLERQHQLIAKHLSMLRELTDDYVPPVHACNNWKALWEGLARLESDLQEHLHVEANVLFPRTVPA